MGSSNRTFASLAASLDGYIASADGDLSWLNDAMRRDEDYGMEEAMARTGAYILGAKTFRESAAMLGTSGEGPPTFVVTHAALEDAPPGVTFYSGDLAELVDRAKAASSKDVHVFGGGEIVTQLLAAKLLDELSLALVPVVLGGGVRLFNALEQWTSLQLTECRSYPSGIVALRYELSS